MSGDDHYEQVEVQGDEFGGLIGNMLGGGGGGGGGLGSLAGQFLGGGGGGGGGGVGNFLGGLMGGGSKSGGGGGGGGGMSGLFGGGGDDSGGGGGGMGGLIGNVLGGGGGGDSGGGGMGGLIGNVLGGGGGGGGKKKGGLGGILGGIGDLIGGKKKKKQGGGGGGGLGDLGGLVGGLGGLIGGGGNRGKSAGGGANTGMDSMKGGFVEIISNLCGSAAHKYLGIDPNTGRIIGSIAGNAIFGLGGKDNTLGNLGKVILDNIISGKWNRKVDPYVPPTPSPLPGPPRPTGGQDFNALRQQCLDDKQLFEDPEFPAAESSLVYKEKPPRRVEWKRPAEIVEEPQLFVEGHSRFDVIQGELGDCWLLAAVAGLTLKDELFYRVVPPDQSFTENYAGIFHFQFWQYGHWVDVVIDDRLPTANGELLYMHSRENTEFWSALLEKAYAKLHGSYEALKGGTTSEALEDFTGGLTEFFDLKDNPPKNLLAMMMRAFEMGSTMGCSIEADPNQWEARLPNGLVRGHAYSITGMKVVSTDSGKVALLRIRNPWGNEQEWNGAWSDSWHGWSQISEDVKQDMGLVRAHDGESWMSFEDFMSCFEKLEICNLGPDVMDEICEMTGVCVDQNKWAANTHDSQWKAGQTAGGCRNFIDTFANNPQFQATLTDADPNDNDDLCTCIVAVLQKYRRQLRHAGLDLLPIGFAIYKTDGDGRLDEGFFQQNQACARSPVFINLREVTARFRVPPGNYVCVPSTFKPDQEGEFMVRIFTNGLVDSQEL